MMPTDWLEQLKARYPRRSGPMRWPRVFLPVRRALLETSWEAIMAGVDRYAAYCRASGREGSDFVTTPENFFRDEIYLEDLVYEQPQSAADVTRKEREAQAAAAAKSTDERAAKLGLRRSAHESTEALATRCMLVEQNISPIRKRGGDSGA